MKCPECNREVENTPFDKKYIELYKHCIFCDLIDAKLMSIRVKAVVDTMIEKKEQNEHCN
jgi:hypothetical protein